MTENMKFYIINLARSVDRRRHMTDLMEKHGLDYRFVDAVDSRDIDFPNAQYDENKYRRCHGKITNPAMCGNYFSHMKALKEFLSSSEEWGVICEDDITFADNIVNLVEKASMSFPELNLLRLSGRRNGLPLSTASLDETYSLVVDRGRQTGTGCYAIRRDAAEKIAEKLKVMYLPFDHSFDREWIWKGVTLRISPIPVSQFAFNDSTVSVKTREKLPFMKRYLTVFPYRAKTEVMRVIYRYSIYRKLMRSRR